MSTPTAEAVLTEYERRITARSATRLGDSDIRGHATWALYTLNEVRSELAGELKPDADQLALMDTLETEARE